MKNGWQTKTLGEVCDSVRRYATARPARPIGTRFLRITSNISRRLRRLREACHYLQDDFSERPQDTAFADGDMLLLVPAATTLARCASSTSRPSSVQRRLDRLRSLDDELDAEFLSTVLQIDATGRQSTMAQTAAHNGINREANLRLSSRFRSPRSPNSSGSSASSTKRLRASPPPKPTPKRTSKTPAPSSKATSNPSSPSAARGGKMTTLGAEIDLLAGFAFQSTQYTDADGAIRLLRGDNIVQGCLRWDDVKKWPANDTEAYDRYQLHDGDVVLAMDRPLGQGGFEARDYFC